MTIAGVGAVVPLSGVHVVTSASGNVWVASFFAIWFLLVAGATPGVRSPSLRSHGPLRVVIPARLPCSWGLWDLLLPLWERLRGGVWLACHESDCSYGGGPSRGPGFVWRVSACGSFHRRSSLLETCCGRCAGRAGSPYGVDLIRRRVSTRLPTTPIRLPPGNDRRGCGRRCWPRGACSAFMPSYLNFLLEGRCVRCR